ncbi:hypothetical protein A3I57_01290 [Candidatus Beckwithbacteria bacterium RIFCSPLOWO2_02_FULL_47_23]|uniref:NYN domain-containing protein n=2 Tax=Candidatus Beckwithiibacteriota TaxID=1752726 RepID=A0A1F5E3D4_9BACT|nr:MAG: hypothetical protein A3E73_02810 [Candidatus Beckwithbacteria bacterium RIFCSPHIGHO2_12_FULL_47_17]OGD61905.1 MAG: hypothetical protein A3I57_01290 [Candidatus Beckwithbacteria bacterium RIFCSPLOWO2_02_FULL_47_23]
MKKMKKTTNLYIDGTNLFAGQNDLFGPRQYLDRVFFYASFMNAKQRGNRAVAEALFYRQVKETDNLFFYKGHRSPASGKEKGVDVHFSPEMVYKTDKSFVLNFANKFKKLVNLPKRLKIVSIKKPRMINIRGR